VGNIRSYNTGQGKYVAEEGVEEGGEDGGLEGEETDSTLVGLEGIKGVGDPLAMLWERVLGVGGGTTSQRSVLGTLYVLSPWVIIAALVVIMLFCLYSVASFGVLRGDLPSYTLLGLWATALLLFFALFDKAYTALCIWWHLSVFPRVAGAFSRLPLIGEWSGASELVRLRSLKTLDPLTVVSGRLQLVVGVYSSAAASGTPLGSALMENMPLCDLAKALWSKAMGNAVAGRVRGGEYDLAPETLHYLVFNTSVALSTGYHPNPPFKREKVVEQVEVEPVKKEEQPQIPPAALNSANLDPSPMGISIGLQTGGLPDSPSFEPRPQLDSATDFEGPGPPKKLKHIPWLTKPQFPLHKKGLGLTLPSRAPRR